MSCPEDSASFIHPSRPLYRLACLAALILVLASSPGAATPALPSDRTVASGYIVDTWTTRHGLTQGMVRVLLQTRDGHLWIGTSNAGLVRFDGVEFVTFDVTNTPALPSNGITALHEGADGVLWIGTYSGLARYNDGAFTAVDDEAARAEITAVTSDASGAIWFTAPTHAAKQDADRWSVVFRQPEALKINTLLVDETGAAWIGSDGGLFVAAAGSTSVVSFAGAPSPPAVRAIVDTSAGVTLVGTDRGLARLDRRTRRLVPQPSPFGGAPVTRLFEDRDRVLWIASLGRLARHFTDSTTAMFPFTTPSVGSVVSAIVQDRDGYLWLGIEAGQGALIRLARRPVSELTQADGLPCDNIGAVAEAVDGTLWVSPWCHGGGGVVAIRNGRMRQYGGLGVVSAILVEPDGGVWAASFDGALYRLEGDGFVEHPIDNLERPAAITTLHRDAEGTLWAGTNKGLFRQVRRQWGRIGEAEGLASHWIRTIVPGAGGTLWIGSDAGVHHYANGRFTSYEHPGWTGRSPVRAIHLAADGSVWVGTYGSGLCRLIAVDVRCFGTLNGLLDTSVHRLIEDEDGFLWMSGDHGIRRALRAELDAVADGRSTDVSVVILDEADGMLSAECNGMAQPAGWQLKDGTLRFPTQRGLVRIDRAAIIERTPPALMPGIEAIQVDGVVHSAASALALPEGVSEIEIRYGAPSLAHPDRVRFRYHLEGHDRHWVDAGAERRARYVGLPTGRYRFHAAARMSDGTWSDTAVVALVLQPGPFDGPAARIGLGALVSIAAAGLWWLRRVRRRRREDLERAMAERELEQARDRDEAISARHQLDSMNRAIERANGQVLALLGHLDLAVLLLDRAGVVQHVTDPARLLLAPAGDAASLEGRAWDECLLIAETDRARVRARIAAPLLTGDRMPIQIAAGGRRYWMELEVRAAPPPADGCILYFHDVTEVSTAERGQRNEGPHGMIGVSSVMQLLYKQIRDVARVDATVLIEGETGTGKELVARAIHRGSARADNPFIAVNSAGLAEPILASQLFGHRRGAFTGAVADQMGVFEAANGGTLFLDEIGDVPLGVQASLLRVLQEREITRLGESRPTPLDVRFVAATHRDLAKEVEAGRFREDLLYRIRVATVQVPPLRERADDVPLLVDAFVTEAARLAGRPVPRVSHTAMEALTRCRWPGNVRQLKGAVEQAVIAGHGPILRAEHLPPEVLHGGRPGSADAEERARLLDALRRANGNRNEAARILGIGRATLYRKLAAHGIRANH